MSDVQTNSRGEFFAAGKLHHDAPQQVFIDGHTSHEGPWLNCDGCNPVVHVEAASEGFAQDNLRDLRREWSEAKAQAKEAKERVDAATAKLKAALAEASGNATRAALHVPGFKSMTLTYTEPWQFDTQGFKTTNPELYAAWASKKPGGQWTLAESKAKS